MDVLLAASELIASLKSVAEARGLLVRDSGDTLTGEAETIRAKWFLGGRKVAYRMSCRLDEPTHTVHFREMVSERSWGIPPPTLTVETTTVSGWKRSGTRTDRSVGGGGSLDFAAAREAIDGAVTAAGWRFDLEGGRMP